jgi:HEAT repeat protein
MELPARYRYTTLAQQGDEEAVRQALLDVDQTVQERALKLLAARNRQETIAFLSDLAKSVEPTVRVQALTLLHEGGQADEPTILSILHQALNDADISVKGYAIQALDDHGGDEAAVLLRLALRDPDPVVRLQVVGHVAPQDQGLSLLQEAMADDDATVRSVAAAKLEEAGSEGR